MWIPGPAPGTAVQYKAAPIKGAATSSAAAGKARANIASILRISGYYVLLRYEGFGQDGSKDFWMNITSEKVHPVGWCITKGKPLIPPKCESRVHSAFNRFFSNVAQKKFSPVAPIGHKNEKNK